jgi:hypothetical protein
LGDPTRRDHHDGQEEDSALLKISHVDVDPELATKWLGYNTHNRNPRPMVVTGYTDAMKNGMWLNDIDPIAFAGMLTGRGKSSPVLLNGQHRLLALVNADVTLPFIVIEGLQLVDQVEMDAGVKRQLADQIRLYKDIAYPVEVAAVLRLTYAYEYDLMRSRSVIGYGTLLQYLDKHPDLPYSIKPAKKLWQAIGGRVSVWGACHYILNQIDEAQIAEEVEEFFNQLETGENLTAGSPVLALRSQMIQASTTRARKSHPLSQTVLMALVFKAWNAWRDGTTIQTLSWRGGGKNPEAFPIPA